MTDENQLQVINSTLICDSIPPGFQEIGRIPMCLIMSMKAPVIVHRRSVNSMEYILYLADREPK